MSTLPSSSSSSSSSSEDLVFKFILVGNSGVGKSCLLKSFMGSPFKGVYTSTIGVDFEIKPINIEGKNVNLQIWDTAGQERFRTITTSYYRSADAILLVFDLTDEHSFTSLDLWLEDIKLYSSRNAIIMLVGNKCDLIEDRQVEFKLAKQYAEERHFVYVETSAKTKINVEKAFNKLSHIVYAEKVKNGGGGSEANGDVNGRVLKSAEGGDSDGGEPKKCAC